MPGRRNRPRRFAALLGRHEAVLVSSLAAVPNQEAVSMAETIDAATYRHEQSGGAPSARSSSAERSSMKAPGRVRVRVGPLAPRVASSDQGTEGRRGVSERKRFRRSGAGDGCRKKRGPERRGQVCSLSVPADSEDESHFVGTPRFSRSPRARSTGEKYDKAGIDVAAVRHATRSRKSFRSLRRRSIRRSQLEVASPFGETQGVAGT